MTALWCAPDAQVDPGRPMLEGRTDGAADPADPAVDRGEPRCATFTL